MIALDASVLVALLNVTDKHNLMARTIVQTQPRPYLIHEINLAEVLAHATRVGKQEVVMSRLRQVVSVRGSNGELGALRLAELRVGTGLRLPDCCALDLARESGGILATFDQTMASAARSLGLEVVPI